MSIEKAHTKKLKNPRRSKYFADIDGETEDAESEQEDEYISSATASRAKNARPKKTVPSCKKPVPGTRISNANEMAKPSQKSTTLEKKNFQRKIYEALIKLREKVSFCVHPLTYKICFRDKIPPRVFLTNQNINDLSINTPVNLTGLSEFSFMGNRWIGLK